MEGENNGTKPSTMEQLTNSIFGQKEGEKTPVTTTPETPSQGGRRKRKGSRRYRGGYADNISFSNVANNAAPYSGGKSRRRKGRKSRKSRKSRKGRRKH